MARQGLGGRVAGTAAGRAAGEPRVEAVGSTASEMTAAVAPEEEEMAMAALAEVGLAVVAMVAVASEVVVTVTVVTGRVKQVGSRAAERQGEWRAGVVVVRQEAATAHSVSDPNRSRHSRCPGYMHHNMSHARRRRSARRARTVALQRTRLCRCSLVASAGAEGREVAAGPASVAVMTVEMVQAVVR